MPGTSAAGSRLGSTYSPSMTNRPIWASQPRPSANDRVEAAVRQPGVAQDHGGHVDGQEAGGVREHADRVGAADQRDGRQRVEPGRRAAPPGAAATAPANPMAPPIIAPAISS